MAMSEFLVDLDRRTLREQCLSMLRTAITDGTLAAGTRLVETELSSGFGVSRGTVREALRHLQQEGLVIKSDRGLAVRVFTTQEIRDIFAVRAAIESTAVETLCSRPDRTDEVAQLREALDRVRAAEGNVSEQAEADLAFHLLLCTLSGNGMLVSTWEFLSGHIRATVMHAGRDKALHNMNAVRHQPIIDAIEAGDAEEGRRVVTDHMAEAADRVTAAFEAREQLA